MTRRTLHSSFVLVTLALAALPACGDASPSSGGAGGSSASHSGSGAGGASSGSNGQAGDPSATPPGGGGPGAGDNGGAPVPPPGGRRVVGYYTAWSTYARNYQVTDIPADRLTHVNYAFANVNDAGECVLGDSYADTDKFYPGDSWDTGSPRGAFHQLQLLKQKHPNLHTIISVGGWTWSGQFSNAAATDASRAHFAQSCVAFMKQYGFDGVDIDWEYPVSGGLTPGQPQDKQNYTLLLQALRRELDGQGTKDNAHYTLSIAAPAGPKTYQNIELASAVAQVDWVNLMTYDFHGGWEKVTGFNAPMTAVPSDPSADPEVKEKFNAQSAVEGYLAAGVPAAKITMGVPFYGRGWAGVTTSNDGLFQAATGLPTGTWEAGVFDYKDLAKNYLPKMTRHWSDVAQVPWLFDPTTGVMISYDDAQSIGIKAHYASAKGLGGVMFWDLSGDDGTLLNAVNANL